MLIKRRRHQDVGGLIQAEVKKEKYRRYVYGKGINKV
jgi:hypothetical protein